MCLNGDVIMFREDLRRAERYEETKTRSWARYLVPDTHRFGVLEITRRLQKSTRSRRCPRPTSSTRRVRLQPGHLRPHPRHPKSVRGEYESPHPQLPGRGERGLRGELPRDDGRRQAVGPLQANEILMSKLKGRVEARRAGAVLQGEVVVEKGALVRSGVIIGDRCTFRGCDSPQCYIRRPPASPGVKVGAAVRSRHIIMAKTHVPHHTTSGKHIARGATSGGDQGRQPPVRRRPVR
jgi:hypothetical protein